MPRSRSEIEERKAVPVIGIDSRRPVFSVGRPFDWVGRGDVMETDRMPAPDLRYEISHSRIDLLREAQLSRSTRHLARIPEPGCSLHLITNGTFDFWDFIHAMLAKAAPRVALDFYASTWILNRRCGISLLDLFDRGLIRRIGLITGLYFKRRESSVFHAVYEGLRTRGQRFMASPNHSKWFAMQLDDGTGIVAEGSANFTENGNAEQVCITNDAGLFAFYKEWADGILGTQPLPPLGTVRESIALPEFEQRPAEAPSNRRRPAALAAAGLGAFAATRDAADRANVQRWKTNPPFCPRWGDHFAESLAEAIAAVAPTLPPGTIVATPPQGASHGADFAASCLAQFIANRFGATYRPGLLNRTDRKRYHGPEASLRQTPYRCSEVESRPPLVLVVDDLATTGTTMRLALQALRRERIAALGFAYSGR